jgi:hypothetical protein
MLKISMPLFVMLPRKNKKDKKAIFNLNNYRNWNRWDEAKIKKLYTAIAIKKLNNIRFNQPIKLTFKYFKASARRSDRSNVLTIHEKYWNDAMVEAGCIVDDDDSHIISTKYTGGDIDRENPRVEIYITV